MDHGGKVGQKVYCNEIGRGWLAAQVGNEPSKSPVNFQRKQFFRERICHFLYQTQQLLNETLGYCYISDFNVAN